MEKQLRIGSVVRSKAGRDKGRYFIVVGLETEYVYIADGELRKLGKPKRKKIKHVEPKPIAAEEISEEALAQKRILDSDIRKCLVSMGYSENKEG